VTREQASMLAYGGLSIAIAQLDKCYGVDESKAKDKEAAKQTAPAFLPKVFITDVLPHLNRWQVFELVDKVDGIDGFIRICITSEEGKLPLAYSFDEAGRAATENAKQLFKSFVPYKKFAGGDIATKLAGTLAKRTHRMQELSSLLSFGKEMKLPFWYVPPTIPESKKEKSVPAPWALQDMFTLWATSPAVNPLCLSSAFCSLLGIRLPQYNDAQARKEQYKQLADNFDKVRALKGEDLWKNLSTLYDAKPKLPVELNSLFSLEVEPRFYSVLSCATVAGVTQQVLAIIERIAPPAPPPSKAGQAPQKKKEEQPLFAIRRLYWL